MIVENIKVEEWIIPVYAVDKDGNSITNLTADDLELYVNGARIRKFNFLKQNFFGTKEDKPGWFREKKNEKIVVLVFDTALSTSASILKSKAIAERLVSGSGIDTKFIIFRIAGFHGLSYLGGPSNDKQRVKTIIDKRIIGKENQRSVTSGVDDEEGEKTKYQHEERMFFLIAQTRFLSQKSSGFASSFEPLYQAISNINGTKFIYLFTEGISNASFLRGDTHASRMASPLLRTGAVLFIINPSGGRGSDDESGEQFLQVLASVSGGKYMTGDTRSINDKISNVHNAYYELTFQSPDERKGGLLRIEVKPKDSDISIHSIRNVEKSKGYLSLTDIEKKLAVLNLISKNPIFKIPLDSENVKITASKEKKGTSEYRIFVPEHFRNVPVDLYRVHMSSAGGEPGIERTVVNITGDDLEIRMGNKPGYSNYFALVNHGAGLALVKGVEKHTIRIINPSFTRGILSFSLDRFRQKMLNEKQMGLLRITLKILDPDGNELKSDEKEITVMKDRSDLRIPLTGLNKGRYNVLVIARDMIGDEETNATVEIQIR